MYRLVGAHVNWNQLGRTIRPGMTVTDALCAWKPPLIVTLDLSPAELYRINSESPKTVIVARSVGDDSGNPDFNKPFNVKQAARDSCAHDLRALGHIPFALAQHINEPVIDKDYNVGTDALKRLAEYEIERASIMHTHGRRCIFGPFGVGQPEVDQMEAYVPAWEACVKYGGLYGPHGYHWPTMQESDNGWFLFRNRKYEHLFPNGLKMAWLERGLDEGSVHPGKRYGWLGHVDKKNYLYQLALDSLSIQENDKNCIGAATFAIAEYDPTWYRFNTISLLEEIGMSANPLYRSLGPINPEKSVDGVDVSWHNKRIMWRQVADSGRSYFVARASVRDKPDDTYPGRWKYGRLAGLVGYAYHYMYPNPGPEIQARVFADEVLSRPPDNLPEWAGGGPGVFLDIEEVKEKNYTTGKKLQPEQVVRFVRAFEDITGWRLGIYTSRRRWNTIMGSDNTLDWGSRVLWVAHWYIDTPSLPGPWSDYFMHQYSSRGGVPGIKGRVDLNRLRRSL